MPRATANVVIVSCLLAGMFFFALGKLIGEVFFIPAAVLLIGGCLVNLIFNRCPGCGRWLGRHHMFIEHCPYCGEPL